MIEVSSSMTSKILTINQINQKSRSVQLQSLLQHWLPLIQIVIAFIILSFLHPFQLTMKLASILLALFPLQVFGFAPSLHHTCKSVQVTTPKAGGIVLQSSPFDDTPSPLEEEADCDSEYDAYEMGTSKSIVFKDKVTGKGDMLAENEDVLTVSLVGTVMKSGTTFLENEDYSFELGGGNTFPGFNEGLVGSAVGTKRFIKVPPNRAYGQRGAKGVPPMSDLFFEVEVKAIARSPVDRLVAKIGTDRLAAFAGLIAFLGISPFLPPISLPSF